MRYLNWKDLGSEVQAQILTAVVESEGGYTTRELWGEFQDTRWRQRTIVTPVSTEIGGQSYHEADWTFHVLEWEGDVTSWFAWLPSRELYFDSDMRLPSFLSDFAWAVQKDSGLYLDDWYDWYDGYGRYETGQRRNSDRQEAELR